MISVELPLVGDVAWQDWEQWAPLALSVLTLIAALGAWIVAGRAARRSKRLAEATTKQTKVFDEQVGIARDAIALAQQEAQSARADADRQRAEAYRMRRMLEEARLDVLAPTIVARAFPEGSGTPGRPTLEYCQLTSGGQDRWRALTGQLQVGRDETYAFRTALTIWFENVSDGVAQVNVIEPAGGELDLLPGHPLVVPARESRSVTWMRLWTSRDLDSDARIQDPAAWLFNLTFTVTDLGVHVRDTYAFDGDLRFFDRDGSWLVVMPEPPLPWTSDVASMLSGRTYESLPASVS
ncbi:hypothetical protein [Cellulomonas sp. Leaf334]|uniref:hypothetical protein n=1 Tax=Cellulomonas sp. Leaf334 TaxID=1736339 RepID=UPI000714162B|nr:hypothetical protein [Cellulomonas sp. Leaf334]KQR16438.1 hypothetical protein ASF78_03365 [Cellulomonas sp. Leaf334]